jgi:hypothetical protein
VFACDIALLLVYRRYCRVSGSSSQSGPDVVKTEGPLVTQRAIMNIAGYVVYSMQP